MRADIEHEVSHDRTKMAADKRGQIEVFGGIVTLSQTIIREGLVGKSPVNGYNGRCSIAMFDYRRV